MSKQLSEDKFLLDGLVTENIPGGKFKISVKVEGEDYLVIGHLSGKMRIGYVKLLPGDKVRVEFSKYDLTKARVVKRY